MIVYLSLGHEKWGPPPPTFCQGLVWVTRHKYFYMPIKTNVKNNANKACNP